MCWGWDSSVIVVRRADIFSSLPHSAHFRYLPMLLSSGCQRQSIRSVRLTTDFHVLPWLKMYGAIPPLSMYALIAWGLVKCRDNFTCTLLLDVRHNVCTESQWSFGAGLR